MIKVNFYLMNNIPKIYLITQIKQLTHLSLAIKDGTEFCTSFNNMSQHSKDKLPTPGLKRKVKTHTIETKFQAIADVERGIERKVVIAKKNEIPPNTLSEKFYTCTLCLYV